MVGYMTTDGFVRKKVESLTLGEKLRKLRQQYRMSYAEIAKETRIQAKYLEYRERGEYDQRPAEVYVRGFVKSYARHLGLDDDAFLKLYDRERGIRQNLGQEKRVRELIRYPAMNTWIITPRTVFIVLLVLILSGTVFYLFSEFRSFVAEPQLLIINPATGATMEGSTVLLQGQTDLGSTVTVNSEPVLIGSSGEFSEELTLQPGLNRIVVRATNRFDKTKEETVVIESRSNSETSEATADTDRPRGFSLVIRASDATVNVTVASGETVLYSGTLVAGSQQHFSDLLEPVRLSTDNALHTESSFDGGAFEPVGTAAVPVSGKMYTKEGQTPTTETGSINP